MTELGFLLELLLNHKLPRSTKEFVTQRVKDVELGQRNIVRAPLVLNAQAQAPSTLAALERQAVEGATVAVVAQNATTQAAMASRAAAISESMSGKVNKDTGRPRKF